MPFWKSSCHKIHLWSLVQYQFILDNLLRFRTTLDASGSIGNLLTYHSSPIRNQFLLPRLSSEFFITKAFVRGSCWDQVLELHLPGDLMVDHLPNPLQGNCFFGKGQYHCFKCDIRDVRSIIMNYNPGCVLHRPLSLLRPHHLLLPGHHVARGVEGVGPHLFTYFCIFF